MNDPCRTSQGAEPRAEPDGAPRAPPVLRPIEPRDDAAMAPIIRAVMTEFGACGEGYSINDAEVDAMCAAYRAPRSAYFVYEQDGRVVGGGGVAPLTGGDGATCELRKMYFLPEARGRGLGAPMLVRCLDAAREFGFARCYLETLASMEAAQHLYLKHGFRPIPGPLGATGHHACNRWYVLDLRAAEVGPAP
jgi:putative acetyltransferase